MSSPPLQRGRPGFQTGHISVGGDFSEILVGGTKKMGVQRFVVVQWGELVEADQFFLNELQK